MCSLSRPVHLRGAAGLARPASPRRCACLLPGLLLVLMTAGLSTGCSAVAPGASGSGPGAVPTPASVHGAPVPTGSRDARSAAAEILGAWDRARARAFAAGDLAALRRLYRPGSTAGTADLRLLRAYRSRGLRIEGIRMQLLGVEVLREGRHRLRLRVTDRLAAAVAVGDRLRVPLPRDTATTRVVELRRESAGGRWQVSEVRPARPRAVR
jgi:hypothetical protein